MTTDAAQSANCTCPSGDGSLRWPCPAHPPESAESCTTCGKPNHGDRPILLCACATLVTRKPAPIDSIGAIARDMRGRYAGARVNSPSPDLVHQHAIMVAADLARWADRLEAIERAAAESAPRAG